MKLCRGLIIDMLFGGRSRGCEKARYAPEGTTCMFWLFTIV